MANPTKSRSITGKPYFLKKRNLFAWFTILLSGLILCQDNDIRSIVIISDEFFRSFFSGNLFGFTDIAWEYAVSVNNISLAPTYNILCYLIIAVWLIPLKIIFALFRQPDHLFIEIIWCKMLLVLCALLTERIIQKICSKLEVDDEHKDRIELIFSSSLLLLVGSVGFGQIDIIGTDIFLLAFLFYLDGDLKRFSLTSSVSICFKGFSFLFFVPFLLFKEKKPSKILSRFGTAMILPVITKLFSMSSKYYSVMKTASDNYWQHRSRIWAALLPGGERNFAPFVVFMILICFLALRMNRQETTSYESRRNLIFLSCLVSFVFIVFFKWHPQWLVLTLPFLSLSYLYIEDLKTYTMANLLFEAGYLLLTCMVYPNNVDDAMLFNGILRLLPWTHKDIHIANYLQQFFGLPDTVYMAVMVAGIAGMLILLFYEFFISKNKEPATDNADSLKVLFFCKEILFYGFIIISLWMHLR